MNFIVQLFQLFFQLLETLLKGLFELVEGIVSAVPKKTRATRRSLPLPLLYCQKTIRAFA